MSLNPKWIVRSLRKEKPKKVRFPNESADPFVREVSRKAFLEDIPTVNPGSHRNTDRVKATIYPSGIDLPWTPPVYSSSHGPAVLSSAQEATIKHIFSEEEIKQLKKFINEHIHPVERPSGMTQTY